MQRPEPLHGLILAAGASLRMGIPKGLLNIHGQTLLSWQIARLKALGCRSIFVVLGFHQTQYLEAMEMLRLPPPWLHKLLNPRPEEGQFSSFLCGARAALAGECATMLLLPVDVPCPSTATIHSLLQQAHSSIDLIVPTWNGRAGHPILLGRSALLALSALPTTSRLDTALHSLHQAKVCRIEVPDPGVLLNLNTPEDWQSWLDSPASAFLIQRAASFTRL